MGPLRALSCGAGLKNNDQPFCVITATTVVVVLCVHRRGYLRGARVVGDAVAGSPSAATVTTGNDWMLTGLLMVVLEEEARVSGVVEFCEQHLCYQCGHGQMTCATGQ